MSSIALTCYLVGLFFSCFAVARSGFEEAMGFSLSELPDTVPNSISSLCPEIFGNSEIVKKRAQRLKQQFDRGMDSAYTSPSDTYRIPKIIHQIWIGDKPFPSHLQSAVASVKKHHPDWQYILWTNENAMRLSKKIKHIITQPHSVLSVGKQADFLRLEVLHRFGGVYLDVDYVCRKPFDFLHKNFDFYCGLVSKWFDINNGVIGCRPKHLLLRYCLKKLKIRHLFVNQTPLGVMRSTGPFFFTQCVDRYIRTMKDEKIIVLPIHFFHGQRKGREEDIYAIHLFASTWNR